MEEKQELSKSEKEITIIDLTTSDTNEHSSIKHPSRTKKRKPCANKVLLSQHVKKPKHNCRNNTLTDIVKKIKLKKISTIPDSKIIQNITNDMITVIDLSSNDSNIENATANVSIIEDDQIQVISATKIVNLNTDDVNVLHFRSNNDPSTSYEHITEDNVTDVLNESLARCFTEVNTSEDLSKTEKELSDITIKNHLPTKCEVILKTPDKLKEQSIPSSQLNVNELEIQLENKVCGNDVDISNLITTNSNGEAVCHFYWWDAYENAYTQQGVIYLFGKVYISSIKTYYSCCLTVKHVLRRIYLLPKHSRDPYNTDVRSSTMEDVCNEFSELANKLGIKEYQSRKVWKRYVFEEGVPNYTEYLEIRYPVIYPAIDSKYTGCAIDKVFETTVSPIQLLLMERNIKGPCWLDIKCPIKDLSDVNWCKVKLVCATIENISVSVDSSKLPLPPMVIATLNIRTCLDTKTKQNQIIMVTILFHDEFYVDKDIPKPPFKLSYCLVTKPNGTMWSLEIQQRLSNISYTNVIRCENESDLLKRLLQIIEKVDPDLYIGYDCSYQFDTLLRRMFTLKIADWSKIGKLKHSIWPIVNQKIFVDRAMSGRPICDIKILAKELSIQSISYDLNSLRTTVLKKANEQEEIQPENCSLHYITDEKAESFIKLIFADTLDILLITFELNMIPFVVELTCITGHILSKTLIGGQMERNEFLLSHAFHSENYIIPDYPKIRKNVRCDSSIKKTSNYEGGLVLTPNKGFYTTLVLLMDYISLYPNIIIEYNLCFSTIPGVAYIDYKKLKIPESNIELGIIPKEIYKLIKYRTKVKELMELPYISPSKKMQYNVKQIALKLMANSMYGCLGAPHCRYYAKELAALITSKGREILLNTKYLVENMKYQIIYGDTDSIMIKTNVFEYNEAVFIGNKIKQEVNKLYKSIKLNIDSIFQYLLLFKKKKYAAVEIKKSPSGPIELSQVYKGIEIVRKDWCPLAAEVGKSILNQIFSNQPRDAKIKSIYKIVQDISKTIKENQVPLSSLVISKQLSKNLNDYRDKEQPHIQVAERLNKKGGKIWRAGDVISYVMCKSKIDKTIVNRAYHIDEIKENKSLEIDVNYYLKKQIFPTALRICEPIMELDKILLTKNLVYMPNSIKEQVLIPAGRFKHCIPVTFRCINENCRHEITISGVTSAFPNGDQLFLNTACPNKSCRIPLWKNVNAIHNKLQLSIRQAITMYYSNQLKCKNSLCSNIVSKFPLNLNTTYPKCNKCKDFSMCRIYTETNLYDQICFYYHIFDLSHPQYKLLLTNCSEEVISVYNTLRHVVDKYLKCTAYLTVDFDEIFQNKSLNYTTHGIRDNINPHEYTHMDNELS
ncbi:hypothetical protein KPH14_006260 [Odynerus spinipes]|uniref:DNA polymerase n=1 Tax=Odynerus spinipes TaxID=1348599 RepID=A0AAD9RIS3_9HYME|nr:hypothetical protein KPH14_006260 [Odynerus spinipes]